MLIDRVYETTTTTGTGTLILGGAVAGYQSFEDGVGVGNTCYYCCARDKGDWEIGIGTVASGTLSRDTVLASSNSDALVDFGAGSKQIFVTFPADKAVYKDAAGKISVLDGNSTRLVIDPAANPAVGRIVIPEDATNSIVLGAGNDASIGFNGSVLHFTSFGYFVDGFASVANASFSQGITLTNFGGTEIYFAGGGAGNITSSGSLYVGGTALNLQYVNTGNITCFHGITSGTPVVNIYGYNTGTSAEAYMSLGVNNSGNAIISLAGVANFLQCNADGELYLTPAAGKSVNLGVDNLPITFGASGALDSYIKYTGLSLTTYSGGAYRVISSGTSYFDSDTSFLWRKYSGAVPLLQLGIDGTLSLLGDDQKMTFGAAMAADSYITYTGSKLLVNAVGGTECNGLLINGGFTAAGGLMFGDGDSGFIESADDVIYVYMAGTQRWKFSVNIITGILPNMQILCGSGVSATVPKYTFYTDENTGIGTSAADTLSLITGGVERVTVGAGDTVSITGTAATYLTIDTGSTFERGIKFVAGGSDRVKIGYTNNSGNAVFQNNWGSLTLNGGLSGVAKSTLILGYDGVISLPTDNQKLAFGAAGSADSYIQYTGTLLDVYAVGGTQFTGNIGVGISPSSSYAIRANVVMKGTNLAQIWNNTICSFRNSSTTNNSLTAIVFEGLNDSSQSVSLCGLVAQITDRTAGAVDGDLIFLTSDSNTPTETLRLKSNGTAQFRGGIEIAPSSSETPTNNGDLVFELTNDTTITIKARGSDSTVRSIALTIA